MRNISVALKGIRMSKQDAIVRQVRVSASVDRVWRAITQAESLAQWFGDSAEVDLRVGGSITIGWSGYEATTSGVVERVEEPNVFAFRWQPLASVGGDSQSTLVTFTLTQVNGGTDLRVEETGLSALPGDVYDRRLEENSSGWTAELADLVAYLGDPQ
jgi:uncharacterized protein YndB with AHSA1/START domain